jgi:ABC-type transporter Mla subunit MlaD
MPEETFRIVVAAAVLIACLAFVVQAGVVLALFRLTRKMQEKTAGFMDVAEPVLARVEPVLEQAVPVIERIGPALDAINDTAARLGPAIDRFLPVIDKTIVIVERAGVLVQSANQMVQEARPLVADISDETLAIVRSGREQVERAGALIQSAKQVTATANQILQDVRPHIAQISGETAAIVHAGREQVERVGDLLHDAGDRARARLEQINHDVESTVNQIEHVSQAVKSAVLRPVREVNGIAAGISAAVSTLVRGQKSSVDSATQDEEMFI